MTDYDVLAKLYRRACDATGKRPYVIICSSIIDVDNRYTHTEVHDRHGSCAEDVRLFGVPIVVVPRKGERIAVARVEMSNQHATSKPTGFLADWAALDYCFEAVLEPVKP